MSEAAPEAPAAPAQEQQPTGTEARPPAEPPTVEELQDSKAEARKWEQRAKENHQAKTELEKQRQAP
jgi:hypothetical protein